MQEAWPLLMLHWSAPCCRAHQHSVISCCALRICSQSPSERKALSLRTLPAARMPAHQCSLWASSATSLEKFGSPLLHSHPSLCKARMMTSMHRSRLCCGRQVSEFRCILRTANVILIMTNVVIMTLTDTCIRQGRSELGMSSRT